MTLFELLQVVGLLSGIGLAIWFGAKHGLLAALLAAALAIPAGILLGVVCVMVAAHVAFPCSSAAAITSASRLDPPGCTMAVAPASAAASTPSRNGKKASDPTTDPARAPAIAPTVSVSPPQSSTEQSEALKSPKCRNHAYAATGTV